MFYHMKQVRIEIYKSNGNNYEISVYKADEDNHLRGYISSGGFSDSVIHMSQEIDNDMRHENKDPIETLISIMKDEIDTGKFPSQSQT